MIRVAGGAAQPAPGQALQELVRGDLDEQCRVDCRPVIGERPVQCFRLGARTRKAVEDRPALRVRGVQPLEQHANGQLVGDELAALHVPAGREPERAAVAGRSPEEIARGHPGQAEVARKHVGLGSLPCSRRAEKDEDPHRGPPRRPSGVLTG